MKRCTRLLRPILLSMVSFGLLLSPTVGSVPAAAAPAPPPTDMAQIFTQRKQLYDRISASTGIPWHYLAAADQYERTIAAAKKRPKRDGAIGVYYSEPEWTGLLNPDHSDTDPVSIAFFHGKGKDGDGDGKADPNNDADLLYSFAYAMKQRGTNEEDLLISLWEIYHNSRSVQRIKQFSSIYSAFDSLDLHAHAFPLPLTADYSYRSTWGAKRGWGGRRIHEGTDLYAGYASRFSAHAMESLKSRVGTVRGLENRSPRLEQRIPLLCAFVRVRQAAEAGGHRPAGTGHRLDGKLGLRQAGNVRQVSAASAFRALQG